MKLFVIALPIILTGCVTPVPVKMKFPQAPETFLQPCPDLKKLGKDVKLSDVAKTVVENYTQYHECSLKNDAWVEWYKTQKKIFEEVK